MRAEAQRQDVLSPSVLGLCHARGCAEPGTREWAQAWALQEQRRSLGSQAPLPLCVPESLNSSAQ